MNFFVIGVVGLVATAFMTSLHSIAERMSLGTLDFSRSVGAFLLASRKLRSHNALVCLHFVGGLIFATIYAYVFGFLQPEGLIEHVRTGGLVGLLHGFFIGLFFLAFHPDGGLDDFHLPSGILNVASHVLYGLVVGAGLGAFATTGSIYTFMYAAMLSLFAMWLIAYTVTPKSRLRAWRKLELRRRYERQAAVSVAASTSRSSGKTVLRSIKT